MSCRYACTCGGNCMSCSSQEPERYFGEAEDLLSQQMGYRNYDDHMASLREQEPEQIDDRVPEPDNIDYII